MYYVQLIQMFIYLSVIEYGSWAPEEKIFAPKDEDYPNIGFMPPIGWDWDIE